MHPVTFSMKRVFLRSVAILRDAAALYHLTPARFDMLTAIGARPEGIGQSTLRMTLGVSSPTVSRMLRSLQMLGYVLREIDPFDRRRRWLRLTEAGVYWLNVMNQDLTEGPFGEILARGMVSPDPHERDATERAMATTRTLLQDIRGYVGDGAWVTYPGYLPSGERAPTHPVHYPSDRMFEHMGGLPFTRSAPFTPART